LRWEQKILPGLARDSRAELLHWTGIRAALFTGTPQLVSPAGYDSLVDPGSGRILTGLEEAPQSAGLADRLRLALGQGGFSRSAGLCWPNDLPEPDLGISLSKLPPMIHPRFHDVISTSSLPELPETYILYHGPQTNAALHRLVEAWSWATGSIGEYYPLLVLGIEPPGSLKLNSLLEQAGLAKTVSLLPPLSLENLIYLYQHCKAVFHPAGVPIWGGPLRAALACGKPLVALETAWSDSLVGPAGYLVKPDRPDSSRALGAALITVIVEEEVAANLAQAARERSASWHSNHFTASLETAYQTLTSGQ